MLFPSFLTTAVLACSLFSDNALAKHGRFGQKARERRDVHKRATPPQMKSRTSQDDFRFLKDKTKPYLVDSLPDVDFDIGELYSGLVPIDEHNSSRALFFAFQPTVGAPVDEITIWLNGGPGCSSLEGFFQENGRFTWVPGTFKPVENPYSWVNLTNVLWVDQPVGTGFSIGTPTAVSQEETAADFVKFFKNWQKLFGVKNFKIYVTGESYAGRYVPYISAAFLDQNDTEHFDLRGALAYDPCIGQFDYVQEEAPTVPFVQQNANMFNFNETFMAELEKLHETCGYKDFIDEYLQFPPPGNQPPKPYSLTSNDARCDVFDLVNDAVMTPNPCFDLYEITSMCPLQWDVLGFPTSLAYEPEGATVYFDRPDVKRALHAPNITWDICSNEAVFVGPEGSGPEGEGDLSANPIEKVLPQVIEGTNRVLIGNGDYDMVIITNGTLLSIQNMTWNGELGFQERPSTPIEIDLPDLQWAEVLEENGLEPTGQGIMGIQHYERGLMWVETFQSGHMQPQYQPRVSYRHLQWLLGRIDSL